MTDVLSTVTSLANGGIPTGVVPTGVAQTASNLQKAATTAVQVATAAASTALDIKDAWSSPGNCLRSNYCRIPVAIIILIGIFIILGCLCCIKGCVDCLTCGCCCCRSSPRTRERLRPPEPQAYAPTNYKYNQQPQPYQSRMPSTGGGNLFPMPERPKYERLGDEEQGIRLDDMRPKHAYIDGDDVVAEPPARKDTTPIVPAASPPPARSPRSPKIPYASNNDGYHSPPPALLPGAGQSSGRASPIRQDYQSSPARPYYNDDRYGYGGGEYSNQYDTGYRGGGGYRNDNDPYYYENSRGGYGGSRGGEYVV